MEGIGVPTRGEAYERLAFSFCKVATVALLTGRWCLPVASGLCAGLFLMAWASGKRDTRCLLRSPLLAAAVYGAVCVASVWWNLRP